MTKKVSMVAVLALGAMIGLVHSSFGAPEQTPPSQVQQSRPTPAPRPEPTPRPQPLPKPPAPGPTNTGDPPPPAPPL